MTASWILLLLLYTFKAISCDPIFWDVFPNTELWPSLIKSLGDNHVDIKEYVGIYIKPFKELLSAANNYSLNPYYIRGASLGVASFCLHAIDINFESKNFTQRNERYLESVVRGKLNFVWKSNPIDSMRIVKIFDAETVNTALIQFIMDNIAVSSELEIWNQRKDFVTKRLSNWIEANQDKPYTEWRSILPREIPIFMIQEHFIKGLSNITNSQNDTEISSSIEKLKNIPVDHSKMYIEIMQLILWFFVAVCIVLVDCLTYGLPFAKEYRLV